MFCTFINIQKTVQFWPRHNAAQLRKQTPIISKVQYIFQKQRVFRNGRQLKAQKLLTPDLHRN